MPYAVGNGLSIWYEETGRGEPVILVGGLTNPLEVFALQVAGLSERYRVVTFDNRGTGRTRVPDDDGRRSMPQFADDLRALLDALELERAHLLGVSMGGMIVQELAATSPERAASLILGCTTPFHLGEPRATPPDRQILEVLFAPRPRSREEDDRNALFTLVHPETFERRTDRAQFYLDTRWKWPHSDAEVQARLEAINHWSVYDRLPALRDVPVLLMVGEKDRLIPPPNSERIREQLPHAELVTIPDTAHIFFVEEPDPTNRAILDFLDRHPLRG